MLTLKSVLFFTSVLSHNVVSMFFLVQPFRSRLRFGTRNTIFITGAYAIFATNLYGLRVDFPNMLTVLNVKTVATFTAFTIFKILMCWALVKGNPFELLFSIFFLLNFQANSIVFAVVLSNNEAIPRFIPDNLALSFYSIIVVILSVPFMYYLLAKLFKKIIDNKIEHRYWQLLPLLPILFYVYIYISGFGGVQHDGIYSLRDILVMTCINLTAYAVYVLSLQTLINTYEHRKNEEKSDIIQKQLAIQRKQYYNLTDKIAEGKKRDHDWRHHILTIKGLAASRNSSALEKYIDTFKDEYSDGEMKICLNPAVNMILEHYIKQLTGLQCEITTDLRIPRDLPIANSDLCIIFGNLMENAMEAVSRQHEGDKFINISAKIDNGQLIVQFENSYDDLIHKDGDAYLSNKRGGEGAGISTVSGIVENACGTMIIDTDGGIFKASININMTPKQK